MPKPARAPKPVQFSLFDEPAVPAVALSAAPSAPSLVPASGDGDLDGLMAQYFPPLADNPAEADSAREQEAQAAEVSIGDIARRVKEIVRQVPAPNSLSPKSLDADPFGIGALQTQAHFLRAQNASFPLKSYDPNLPAEMPDGTPRLRHGWLLQYLVEYDEFINGRWTYWTRLVMDGELTEEQGPIPPIAFLDTPHPRTMKMINDSLDCIPRHGGWQGDWSSSTYFDYFLDWLLFGLKHHDQPEPPQEPGGCEGAGLRLYQVFQLGPMLLWPHDYFGQLMAESGFGRKAAFYPTPHPVVELMAQMTHRQGMDARAEAVNDCCVGTGRMLLHASNFSLNLYGQDIMLQAVKATTVNAALYMPWLYRPLKFL